MLLRESNEKVRLVQALLADAGLEVGVAASGIEGRADDGREGRSINISRAFFFPLSLRLRE